MINSVPAINLDLSVFEPEQRGQIAALLHQIKAQQDALIQSLGANIITAATATTIKADIGNFTTLIATIDLTAPGPIGSVTPNTGAFTTLNASGNATFVTQSQGDNSTKAATTAYVDTARIWRDAANCYSNATGQASTSGTASAAASAKIPAGVLSAAGKKVRYSFLVQASSTNGRLQVYIGPNKNTGDSLVVDVTLGASVRAWVHMEVSYLSASTANWSAYLVHSGGGVGMGSSNPGTLASASTWAADNWITIWQATSTPSWQITVYDIEADRYN
jgi:hypothetical protein